jgi:hypothetical protein
VIHNDLPIIFAANPLKTLSRTIPCTKNLPDPGAQCGQMKPQPIIRKRPTSERRAAAARANGAKSRGPVTALGKANSSRNSHRHGLRSRTLFADPESAAQLPALLALFEREFQPQSEIEHTLIGTMALARWRQTCLAKLETSLLNREISRLKSLTPDQSPRTLTARAFRSLADHGCSLEIINRLEFRCERHYDRAVDRLTALRAHGIFKKMNIYERSQQVVENTTSHSGPTCSAPINGTALQSAGNPNPKKLIVDARTQQAAENTTPPPAVTNPKAARKRDSRQSHYQPPLTLHFRRSIFL